MATATDAAPQMSGWERWAKRFAKGFLWCLVYLGLALWLGFEPTWQLITLVVVCGFWSDLLDTWLPTAEK